ncbi:gamma-aminobutyric acid type B receptor subunit 2-like isoform X3 [Gigantopelta aegis]|uniref:gamma-aminobutyric acid type B receptor subunit 2-like isoform X3 n=1 Tax=Gigantopelta aegis TaxID=1735272 RepID=UPI001B888883|nr:gamma-aminobutyric acid type B receptor subunit 2-like isoform X3 [Gigantopelta aegis]
MSSPNLNNITLVGCFVLYGSVFLESTTSAVPFCQAKIVSIAVGFSLAFGGLFAKTWRVYLIFTNGAKQKKFNHIDDIEVHKDIVNCTSSNQIYFMGTLFGVQGIILLFGVFLSLQTRKVTVDGLNDSKMIGVCIYNVVVLSFLGVMVSLTLKSNVDLHYGIISCIIILATTVTQCLIIIPKIKGHFNNSSRVGNNEATTIRTVTRFTRAEPTA